MSPVIHGNPSPSGDGASSEVVNGKEVKGRSPHPLAQRFYRPGKSHQGHGCRSASPDRQEQVLLGHSQKVLSASQEQSSGETKLANDLILDGQLPEGEGMSGYDCPTQPVGFCHTLPCMPPSTPAIFQLPHYLRADTGGDFKHPPLSSLLQQAQHFGHKVLATYELSMGSQLLIFGYKLRDRQEAILSVPGSEKHRCLRNHLSSAPFPRQIAPVWPPRGLGSRFCSRLWRPACLHFPTHQSTTLPDRLSHHGCA